MARASGNQESTFSGINVTPLTDVMLVLLITFLLTASSFESDTLSVPLPRLVETQEIEKYGLEMFFQASDGRSTLALAVYIVCFYWLFYPIAAAATETGWTRVLLLTEEV